MSTGFAFSGLFFIAIVAIGILALAFKVFRMLGERSSGVEVPSTPRNPEERELVQILTALGPIYAVKEYRAKHNCALKEAADAIKVLQNTGNLPIAGALSTSHPSSPRMDEADEERILLPILKNEGKIAAIKRYRELSGSGLAEAKARIEFLEERAPLLAAQSNAMPGHIPDELKD